MLKETPIRSIAKAVSWRILATLTTGLLVFAFTRSIDIAFTVGAFEVLAKLLLYFLHERLWNRLSFGRLDGGSLGSGKSGQRATRTRVLSPGERDSSQL